MALPSPLLHVRAVLSHPGEGVQPARPLGLSLRLLAGEFSLVRAQKRSNLVGHR
jgi:hypothetical protein